MAGELILYTTEDGNLVVRLQERDGSVWLTQSQMAELFQSTVSNINKHIKGILSDGEQDEATIEEYSIVQSEGNRSVERLVAHYNLPMILSVGFRVRSARGAQALMQQLFTGRKRLPGYDAPWSERALEDIFQFKKGAGLSKEAVTSDGVKPCILYGELYTRYPEVIREVVGHTNANDGVPSKSGDILVPASTTTTGIDLANATAILESDVLLSGDINILRPKDPKQSAPFFAYLLTHLLKQKIASRAQGITIVHLYAHTKWSEAAHFNQHVTPVRRAFRQV